jgi:hypothetical protein
VGIVNRRHFAKKAVPLAVLILIGLGILIGGGHNNTTTIVGSAIEGLAAILLVSLVFYEVGLSEDRAREAERREQSRM